MFELYHSQIIAEFISLRRLLNLNVISRVSSNKENLAVARSGIAVSDFESVCLNMNRWDKFS